MKGCGFLVGFPAILGAAGLYVFGRGRLSGALTTIANEAVRNSAATGLLYLDLSAFILLACALAGLVTLVRRRHR